MKLRNPYPRFGALNEVPARRKGCQTQAPVPAVLVEGMQGHEAQPSHVLTHVMWPEDMGQFPPRCPLKERGLLFQGDWFGAGTYGEFSSTWKFSSLCEHCVIPSRLLLRKKKKIQNARKLGSVQFSSVAQ